MRIAKIKDGHITRYHLDEEGRNLETETTDESVTTAWIGQKPLGYTDKEGTYWYISDHQGSTFMLTDGEGNILWEDAVNPFGITAGSRGSQDSQVLYTGKIFDADADLYYFNARWYDPETGRFASEDPARDGVNWYAYVGNNPLKYTDPMGLWRTREERKRDRANRRESRQSSRRDRQKSRASKRSDRSKQLRDQGKTDRADRIDNRVNKRSSRQENKRENQKIENAQDVMNHDLVKNGATVNDLKDLVNIDNLADILSDPSNRENFDSVTQDWMNGIGNQRRLKRLLRRQLKKTSVISGADNSLINSHLNAIGSKFQTTPSTNAVGLGDTIYVMDPNAVSSMDAETAALLGHEGVHGIQSMTHGGLANFEKAYVAAGTPTPGMDWKDRATVYYSNTYERAAYSFGPVNRTGWELSHAKNRGVEKPVLLDSKNEGWWE